ncbi:hypothetical protein P691DRAFT_772594 [Macrolepiota fuliginosa MF-IS2]|uniref:DUF6534 domain-containing protein n=1 Tax=Macrolepiota fuliginosa MF-IS2 TaxID=1400762 RepID=A0A9P5XN23_9AGAR|nr:hypothetical protein P691DRAFT_772594 [Macrolepiota fuliginosa MF-IS2]
MTVSTTPSFTTFFDLEPTVGSFFLGGIASVGLTGVTTLQSWLYFQKYPQDSNYFKLLVAFIWSIEMFRSAVSVHGGYYYSVKHWGDPIALLQPVWSMKLMIMLTNVIEFVVHCFFIHKVWQSVLYLSPQYTNAHNNEPSATYGRARWLCGLIALFALGDFAMGTTAYVTAVMESDYVQILHGTPSRFATAALACAVGADWLITATLVKFFKENRTQFPRTSHLLKKLIFYAVNLGLLTSLTDVVVLVLSNAPWPSLNFYQLTVFEIVGNLYANSLLACLNARDMVSEELKHKHPVSTYTFSLSTNNSSQTHRGSGVISPVSIQSHFHIQVRD